MNSILRFRLYSRVYYINFFSISDQRFILEYLTFHRNFNIFDNKEDTLGIFKAPFHVSKTISLHFFKALIHDTPGVGATFLAF